jgi:hypothetical protein
MSSSPAGGVDPAEAQCSAYGGQVDEQQSLAREDEEVLLLRLRW